MHRPLAGSAIALSLALMGACNQQTEQSSTANDAASTETAAPAQAQSVFSADEMQMNERMMAAQGANAAEAWVRKMIEHHRGGVAMSETLLAQPNVNPQVAEQARTTIADQQRDIERLEAMLEGGVEGAGQASAYASDEQRMHQQMMSASGPDPSQTWLRKMIEHHRGGVAMSNTAVAQAGNPQVVAMARETADKQNREIETLERMLQG